MDTLKSSLKCLQINPTNWEELALDRPTWRRTVKTGAAIYEANRIAAAKAKREARKSQLRPATVPRTATDTTTTFPDSRDEDQDYTCPHCDRTFTSHIGLVGHLRIHRTEPGEPVPGALTYTHRTRLHCPHCPRTFTHRMGLFGHMRIHESGLDRTPDTPTTSNTSTVHSTLVPSVRDTTTTTTASSVADTDTADFSCPHCPRTFTSRIGLVDLLFEDDYTLNTVTESDTQRSVNHFVSSCTNLSLTINADKTMIIHQPPPNSAHNVPRVYFHGNQLKTINHIAYFNSTPPQHGNLQISKASQTFVRLHDSVCNRHGLKLNTKLKIYTAIILTALLYEAQTWGSCKK
nr:unnamed protein product [Spirometra erinaceieuropaei]